ncbi:MAG: phosphatidylglycerophosphatase A [Alphaproteobacteria bacterium]|nr:phosphatidylglycerophosphatase A [Alphaproteobacteria bacterium]
MSVVPRRTRPPFWHPAALVATVAGLGYLPKAPGTWASAAAVILAVGLDQAGGWIAIAIAAAVATGLGLIAVHVYLRQSALADPPEIVIDELAGQWLTLAFLPFGVVGCVLGFLAFRIFDIVKPWPIPWIEQRSGAWGVVLDDLMAGLYAAASVTVALALIDFAV